MQVFWSLKTYIFIHLHCRVNKTIKESLFEPMIPLIYLIVYRKHDFQIPHSSLMAVYWFWGVFFNKLLSSGLSLKVLARAIWYFVYSELMFSSIAAVILVNFFLAWSQSLTKCCNKKRITKYLQIQVKQLFTGPGKR